MALLRTRGVVHGDFSAFNFMLGMCVCVGGGCLAVCVWEGGAPTHHCFALGWWGLGVAGGMALLHSRGVVHGDLSAFNIVLSRYVELWKVGGGGVGVWCTDTCLYSM